MKFGKSYMETLANPSFPKEWREGAIEYKQLKKLINGVVAELESIGLGADVLRDLIVHDDDDEEDNDDDDEEDEKQVSQTHVKSESEADELVEGVKSNSINKGKRKDNRHDLHHLHNHLSIGQTSSKLPTFDKNISLSEDLSNQSSSNDISFGSSADDCEECAKELKNHQSKDDQTDSPAADWVAHIAHAKHSRRQRRSSRKETSPSPLRSNKTTTNDSIMEEKDVDQIEYLRPPLNFSSSIDNSTFHSDSYSGNGGSSDEINGNSNMHSSSKMGKKQLEELRRRYSSVDGIHSVRSSTASSKSKSKDRIHDWGGHAWRERSGLQPNTNSDSWKKKEKKLKMNEKMRKSKKWVIGKDGRRARAEYELGGTSEKPIPQIRLYVESPIQSDDELNDGGEADSEGESDEDEEVQIDDDQSEKDEGGNDKDHHKKQEDEDEDDKRFEELSESRRGSICTVKPLQGQPRSPIIRPNLEDGKRKTRTREIVIPLNADTEFLDTLTGALSNLSSLQETQRQQFQQSTETLCKAVSKVASPYGNKNDLYAWREIFSLWCELQIFESQREKDRGELSVDETEARLKKFAEELAKRGWNSEAFAMESNHYQKENKVGEEKNGKSVGKFAGKLSKWKGNNNNSTTITGGALPMKDPKSIAALEDFIRLNLALLDVKKFQRVNVEAARKILKKHDKRTALTASSNFGAFVEQQEKIRNATASAAAGVGISSLVNIPEDKLISSSSNQTIISTHGASTHPSLAALLPSSTSALLSASLPHILLSLMTTELLPILPSIDDYSCAICTGVAWRPIKLDCGHLFCIRCLVKLQKQGKNDCPMCRAVGVVGSADERNMDPELIKYLRDWFPKEVNEKTKENEKDRHKEEMLELGLALENEKCQIM